MTDRLTEFENRLLKVEQKVQSMDTGLKTLTDAFDAFKIDLGEKLDNITVFVTGANTVFGLARKHWKRIFVFGAGFMTAAGVGNPNVNAFITSFFGG